MSRPVLFVGKSDTAASARHRAIKYFGRLREAGFEPRFLEAPSRLWQWPGFLNQVRQALITVLLRRCFEPPLAAMVRRCARALIFDFDDAVFLGDDGIHSVGRTRRFAATLRQCECVWAGNPYLAEAASPYNRHVQVIPTGLEMEPYAIAPPKPEGCLDLVWIGSMATRKYLEAAMPCLEEAAGHVPRLRLKVIADFQPQSKHIQTLAVPWREETETLELACSHIGIAPMTDDPWTRGKCGFKLLQYMAAGLPVISSAAGENARIVVHGQTGFLARDAADWPAAISRLAADEALRHTMGRAGRQRVREAYSADIVFEAMRASLRSHGD